MSLGERFGVGFRWVVGGGFPVENKRKGKGGGEGGGVGWGQTKEQASRCAHVCQNYPLAVCPLVFPREVRQIARCKSAMRCTFAAHDVNRDFRALNWTETCNLCNAMCITETTFAMRCIFTAICILTAEIHCDVGRNGSIAARAMPRCGELRLQTDICSRRNYFPITDTESLLPEKKHIFLKLPFPFLDRSSSELFF